MESQLVKDTKQRRNDIDAMKGLGIILVVLGHYMEYYRGTSPLFNGTFEWIYLFHMGLFCICSGEVARFHLKKLITQQVWLYLVAQSLFLWLRVSLGEEITGTAGMARAILEPWRHMWYLYALIIWTVTVPLLHLAKNKLKLPGSLVVMALLVILALESGKIEWPWWFLGRIVSFYPFFAFGVLFGDWIAKWNELARRHWWVAASCALAFLLGYAYKLHLVFGAAAPVYLSDEIFQSGQYTHGGNSMIIRLQFYGIGLALTFALVGALGGSKWLAALGKRTLPVYIFHMPIFAILIDLGVFGPPNDHKVLGVVIWLFFSVGGAVSLLSSQWVCAVTNAVAGVWYHLLNAILNKVFKGKSKAA